MPDWHDGTEYLKTVLVNKRKEYNNYDSTYVGSSKSVLDNPIEICSSEGHFETSILANEIICKVIPQKDLDRMPPPGSHGSE